MMAAVVLTPAQVKAQRQLCLVTIALHVVQHDRARTIAKICLALGCTSRATAKLPTHHIGIEHVPVIITHRPPCSFVEDLHATLAAVVTIHHSDRWFDWTRVETQVHQSDYRAEVWFLIKSTSLILKWLQNPTIISIIVHCLESRRLFDIHLLSVHLWLWLLYQPNPWLVLRLSLEEGHNNITSFFRLPATWYRSGWGQPVSQ